MMFPIKISFPSKMAAVATMTGLLALGTLCATAQSDPVAQQSATHGDSMPGMDMGKSRDNPLESGAMHAMESGHAMDERHMRMTPMRQPSPEDLARADKIAATLRDAIEKYRDYRVALAEGFRIFAPNVPQPQYHFTNSYNAYLETFTFDPARPTSLLYKKTRDGYELVGAMFTAPKGDTLDQLNERVPLGVARWHEHTNICFPARGKMAHADWKRFGFTGSITTPQACAAAAGRFYPQIFGWMVHVYPFETTESKVWAH